MMLTESLRSLLCLPFETEIPQVIALRRWSLEEEEALHAELSRASLPSVILPPSLPWDPLAPLKYLCREGQRSFPVLEDDDTSVFAAWLGWPVAVSRFFLRVAEGLRGCRRIAFLRYEDTYPPLLQDFFRLLRQGEIKIPISFVFRLPPDAPVEIGVRLVDRPDLEPSDRKDPRPSATNSDGSQRPLSNAAARYEPSTSPSQSRRSTAQGSLSKAAARYLGQALIWGPSFDPVAMAAISRADHRARSADLRAAGWLSETGSWQMEGLASSGVIWPNASPTWRRNVLRAWAKRGSRPLDPSAQRDEAGRTAFSPSQRLPASQEIWLRWLEEPPLAGKEALSLAALADGILHFGPARLGLQTPLLSQPDHHVSADARFFGWMALSSVPEIERPPPEALGLPPLSFGLAKARDTAIGKDERGDTLASLLQGLTREGWLEAAGLVATDLARWHLGHSRLRPAFQLLTPYREADAWPLRWLSNTLLAEGYGRMGRMDLAHHALEKATASLPRPISPVLAGDLRLLSARLHEMAGDTTALALQLTAARDTFRAAGDGPRLGRYLLVAAEAAWKRKDLDEARAFFGRALDLFRRYHDPLGAQEAQLKLGLVVNGAPASILRG